MANPLTQFIRDRFLQPAINAEVEKAIAGAQPGAYGVGTVPETSLAKAIGQPRDANYVLLYALYKLNTDVSGRVHYWVGGVSGAGWRITSMDPDATLTTVQEAQVREIERWLKDLNPSKHFESMLYEVVQHFGFGIVGDAFWYVCDDKQGRLARLDDVTRNQAGSARPIAACAGASRVMRTTSLTSQVTASLFHE